MCSVFAKDLERLWWVNIRPFQRIQDHAPLEENIVEYFMKCFNLVHFECKINRVDLWLASTVGN